MNRVIEVTGEDELRQLMEEGGRQGDIYRRLNGGRVVTLTRVATCPIENVLAAGSAVAAITLSRRRRSAEEWQSEAQRPKGG
jgi:hypothetical protein